MRRPDSLVALRAPSAVAVFTTVLVEGATSRVAIARSTGLTPAAVTKAVTPLLAAGLLRERGSATANGVGRPPSIVEIAGDAAYFLGVKITADALIGVVIDLAGTVRATASATLRSSAVEEVVDRIGTLAAQLTGEVPGDRVRGLGLSLSGDVERVNGLAVFSPFLNWRGVPIEALVRSRTGMHTVVENDVRALTCAERWFGAGVGASSLAVVTIGAGVGCGLFVGGQVLAGSHGVTGELGHVPVADPALRCYCGGSGCVEAATSIPSIVRRAGEAAGRPVASFPDAITLAADEPAVRAVFEDAGTVVGRALATVANLLGPERIVLTGEALDALALLEANLRSALTGQAYGGAIHSELLIRPLPFEEWARGAATVALGDFVGAI